jgi:hypothetical protein
MYYKDTLATRIHLTTEFHHFANMINRATMPEICQALLTNTPFSVHAMIGTLNHKVHICHQLSNLTESTWAQSDTAYIALLGLGSTAQPIAFNAKQVQATVTTTIPNHNALHNQPEQLRTLHLTGAPATIIMDIAHLVRIPPFLFNMMTADLSANPAELFSLNRLVAKTFAEEQANIDENSLIEDRNAIRTQVYA